jgi:hypothetical protein
MRRAQRRFNGDTSIDFFSLFTQGKENENAVRPVATAWPPMGYQAEP